MACQHAAHTAGRWHAAAGSCRCNAGDAADPAEHGIASCCCHTCRREPVGFRCAPLVRENLQQTPTSSIWHCSAAAPAGVNQWDSDAPPKYVNNTHLSARVGRLNPDWNEDASGGLGWWVGGWGEGGGRKAWGRGCLNRAQRGCWLMGGQSDGRQAGKADGWC